MAASAGPIPWKLGGIQHCLAVRARDRRCLWKAGKMAGSVWGWEPALETGPQEGKGREHGWAEAHEAHPGSVGRCWIVPGQRWPLVLRDLAPAFPGVGSRHAQLAFPICSPIHRTGRAERLLGCERALQTTPAPIRVLLETEIRSSPLESITFRQWSCSLKSGHRGCTSLSSVALVMQVSSTVP